MRLSMQCDLGGARARSEERALGLTPFSQFLQALPLSGGNRGEGTGHKTRAARGRSSDGGSAAWAFPGRVFTLVIKREGALASERATDHRAIRLPSPLHFVVRSGSKFSKSWLLH